MRNLDILESSLEQAIISRDSRLVDSQGNIVQKDALFKTKVGEIFSEMLSIIYIGNEYLIDYNEIDEGDLNYQF